MPKGIKDKIPNVYSVAWYIEVIADSYEDAARQAYISLKGNSREFEVINEKTRLMRIIDLKKKKDGKE